MAWCAQARAAGVTVQVYRFAGPAQTAGIGKIVNLTLPQRAALRGGSARGKTCCARLGARASISGDSHKRRVETAAAERRRTSAPTGPAALAAAAAVVVVAAAAAAACPSESPLSCPSTQKGFKLAGAGL